MIDTKTRTRKSAFCISTSRSSGATRTTSSTIVRTGSRRCRRVGRATLSSDSL